MICITPGFFAEVLCRKLRNVSELYKSDSHLLFCKIHKQIFKNFRFENGKIFEIFQTNKTKNNEKRLMYMIFYRASTLSVAFWPFYVSLIDCNQLSSWHPFENACLFYSENNR